ncbi:hypothetical protein [Nocardia africana]|uniref:Uncharacterized protein n=1 Tax=Nocardia africana TaxID=134964 RepID=A0A378X267_9NOCA|nr:hypothetical protein [Nocardia africana]MCC3311487.1 hypothetical protein [Nocardia africana]SUA47252.1 Uncharacterised protein [Nocardia africana]
MARYGIDQLDQCAADALALSSRVRESPPEQTYRTLTYQCHRDPERMAQLLMTLAVFVDPETATTGELLRIVGRITGDAA